MECFEVSESLSHLTSHLARGHDLTVPLQSTQALTMILGHQAQYLQSQYIGWMTLRKWRIFLPGLELPTWPSNQTDISCFILLS